MNSPKDVNTQAYSKESFVSRMYDLLRIDRPLEGPSESDMYKEYFTRGSWNINEFVALLISVTPKNFENLRKIAPGELPSNILEKLGHADEVRQKFSEYADKELSEHAFFSNGNTYFSLWRYVKWLASQRIKVTKKFYKHLPYSLMEQFQEFHPGNLALRTKSIRSREYHRAKYQEQAQLILKNSEKEMTHAEIDQHPILQKLLDSFQRQQIIGADGKPTRRYKERTRLRWISAINPKKRGRPPKTLQNE